MSNYKCDICGGAATVHITKIIDSKKVKIHLCSECSQKASIDTIGIPEKLFPKLKELEQEIIAEYASKSDACPKCGASLTEIEKGARFSCECCYQSLGNRLLELLAQMHAATRHLGKSPKHHAVDEALSIFKTTEPLRSFEDIVGEDLFPDSDIDDLEIAKPKKVEKAEKPAIIYVIDTEEKLKKELSFAISEERYEDAAKLRDQLKKFIAAKE